MVHLKTFHLFAGAGGGILADMLLGHIPIGAVEIEKYPREVLLARQEDGILPQFPIWDDVTTFRADNKECAEYIKELQNISNTLVIAGGFPCQDISAAGKGAGIEGKRSGLWKEMARIIDEIRPQYAFMENSPMLTCRGLGTVLGDLAEMGYNARWCLLGADDTGAPHRRKRIWILAYTSGRESGKPKAGNGRKSVGGRSEKVAYSSGKGLQGSKRLRPGETENSERRKSAYGAVAERRDDGPRWWNRDPADLPDTGRQYGKPGDTRKVGAKTEERTAGTVHNKSSRERQREVWPIESRLGRVAHGVSHRVDRLKSIGNAQVSTVAALAWSILSEGLIAE